MSRDEKEDNHDIIKLSREALQHVPTAAYHGACCVTTPSTAYCFVLGDSDNMLLFRKNKRCSAKKFKTYAPALFRDSTDTIISRHRISILSKIIDIIQRLWRKILSFM